MARDDFSKNRVFVLALNAMAVYLATKISDYMQGKLSYTDFAVLFMLALWQMGITARWCAAEFITATRRRKIGYFMDTLLPICSIIAGGAIVVHLRSNLMGLLSLLRSGAA